MFELNFFNDFLACSIILVELNNLNLIFVFSDIGNTPGIMLERVQTYHIHAMAFVKLAMVAFNGDWE